MQLGVCRCPTLCSIPCLCLYVKETPAVVEMLEDLEGGDVMVRCEAMLELGIILFVQVIA